MPFSPDPGEGELPAPPLAAPAFADDLEFLNARAVQNILPASVEQIDSRGIALTFVLFDDREYQLAMADKAGGPATEWPTAEAAARAHDAAAAINGGFFTPEGAPLGLVIEAGARFGSWNAGSSLTAGVLAVERSPRLLRSRHWRSFSPTLHLLQTGPFLVENSASVRGLSAEKPRPRSFLAWDGRHHWAFGVAKSATLAQLSAALAAQPVPDFNITTALNLDGGRSSDLWIGPSIKGGPTATRKIWNNSVRNYVLLIAHAPS
jgi:hypothetical protein